MEITETKKGWSWLGFFFGPYYYAGYGLFKKGLILGFISIIPIIGYIAIPIYCGINAKKELPTGERPFDWKSSFGLLGVFVAIVLVFATIATIVEMQKEDKHAAETNEATMAANSPVNTNNNEFTISSIKIGKPLSQFDGILKCELTESPAIASKSGKTVVAQCRVDESKAVHWNDFIGQPHEIYLDSAGNVCGFAIFFDVRLSSKDLAYMSRDIYGEELPYRKTRTWGGEELDAFEQTRAIGQMEETRKLIQNSKGISAVYVIFNKAEEEQ